jgi:hypothetical protein
MLRDWVLAGYNKYSFSPRSKIKFNLCLVANAPVTTYRSWIQFSGKKNGDFSVYRSTVSALPAESSQNSKTTEKPNNLHEKAVKKHFYKFITPSVFVSVTDVCTVVTDIFL